MKLTDGTKIALTETEDHRGAVLTIYGNSGKIADIQTVKFTEKELFEFSGAHFRLDYEEPKVEAVPFRAPCETSQI